MFQLGSFSSSNLFAGLIFGSIGLVAFIYGKKEALWRSMVIGAALMVYPYLFSTSPLIYLIGIAFTATLYFWRE